MIHSLRITLACVAASLTIGCAAEADEVPVAEPPALVLTGRVVDAANVISAPVEDDLTAKLTALEEDTGVQFVVATTPSLKGKEIEAYSLTLGNAWGLGDAERNDGLLLLVAPAEKKVRIEVGLGLETTVTNAEAAAIVEVMMPDFRRFNYDDGVTKGVDRLILEVTHTELKPAELKEAA